MSDNNLAYAGIDIGGTNIKFGLFNAKGQVLYREQKPTMADKGPQSLMHLITNIGERLMLYAAEENIDVRWLGVGTAGAIDFKKGKVIGPSPNIPGWEGMEIGRNLKERLNMPVYVDNDVNSMALAEHRFGTAIGYDSVLCLTLGTGVGGAIIIDGKVYRGANSTAGELGHMSIKFDGPQCKCGNYGCLESFVASHVILSRVKSLLDNEMTAYFKEVLDGNPENISIKKLFNAYKREDEVAVQVLDETAGYVGTALAGLVNLLNPELVVIGGGIAEGSEKFIGKVKQEVKKRAFSSAVENLLILKASLGNDAGFIGAGLLGETV
ncbi:MAG: ROK family protein [candidate division Zixibacteria bacterium]|nr:ROK family protein [candidate division Zixibacteria bacterium]